ncbi:MAG: right-handed parallel beta-helix repeat-containing protein [Planctomycetota bacterium]
MRRQSFGTVLFALALVACAGDATKRSVERRDRNPASALGVVIPEGVPFQARGRVRVAPGEWLRPAVGEPHPLAQMSAAIRIEDQDDVMLDLTDVTLRGAPRDADLDAASGIGILLVGCDRATIRGGELGGYKGCIVAIDCHDLTIEDVRFDRYYAGRLRSTTAAEDEGDWLFPHENDAGEWLANYGGAIHLTDCERPTVRSSRGRHGQNGILLTRTSDARIYDNDFSFLSGWGLALYRSSKNVVDHNVFDYCVRGYSHGVYWRGQDSAGILMFERCSDNLFAFNSATHSGDGVFLYGGNDTVRGHAFERGEMDAGGSDRNVWYRNDFSYAVANAIEATFSADNWAIENELSGSHQHGVWGGYSSRMVVLANTIRGTIGGGVSIEHGQECAIVENEISENDLGVELWWDEDPDLVLGPFGQARDTRSRDHWVIGNRMEDNARDLVVTETTGLVIAGNLFASTNASLPIEDVEVLRKPLDPARDARELFTGVHGSRPSGRIARSSVVSTTPPEPEHVRRARAFTCPELPGKQETSAVARAVRGGLDTIVMGEWGPWDFVAGEPRPPVRVPGGVLRDARWSATWFSWRDAADPRADVAAWRALASKPLAEGEVANFVQPWMDDDVRAAVGNDHFGLVATSTLTIDVPGTYRLTVVSDDGVRVKLDGEMVLENWTWHAPTRDTADVVLSTGEHTLELEYFQIDGASALSIELAAVIHR